MIGRRSVRRARRPAPARLVLLLALFAGASAPACTRTPGAEPASEQPAEPASSTLAALVPPEWRIEQQHDADFNGDGRTDALLVLRPEEVDGVPARTLVVAMATEKAGGYVADSRNSQLIPGDPSGQLEDPLAQDAIAVRREEFDLTLGVSSARGSAQTATLRYRFRWQPGCFQLVEFRRAGTHRGTLEVEDVTANLLTGEVVYTTGNEQTGDTRTRQATIDHVSRRCLADLPNGLSYDPTLG